MGTARDVQQGGPAVDSEDDAVVLRFPTEPDPVEPVQVQAIDMQQGRLRRSARSPGQQLIQEIAFRSERRQPTESWASHAEALLSLAEKAYPHLDGRSIDAMVNAQLLQSVEDSHLQYLVRRSTPTTVADSVRELTIQQALLQATFLHSSPVIASAEPTQTRPSEPPIIAEFQSRLHSIEESIHELQRMMIHDRSEHIMPVDDRRRRFSRRPPTEWERRRAQCWKCQGFGHIARQCPSASGNGEGSSARTGRMTRNQ
ncbi:hypothetical protein M514_20998 [Trichuris suis]|uniref:CCHC-type domain-containing protein n=1 Tax=Trichuris suis TaxID=68888 RepID=A0A085NBK8_9BILA|nr:hypothetical protein M514_20998 [Trichuris suis]